MRPCPDLSRRIRLLQKLCIDRGGRTKHVDRFVYASAQLNFPALQSVKGMAQQIGTESEPHSGATTNLDCTIGSVSDRIQFLDRLVRNIRRRGIAPQSVDYRERGTTNRSRAAISRAVSSR